MFNTYEEKIPERLVVLRKAEESVMDRAISYGHPENSFNLIANFWNTWLCARYGESFSPLSVPDVAMMLALMKVARLCNNPSHKDSIVDLAGYAACFGEIILNTED